MVRSGFPAPPAPPPASNLHGAPLQGPRSGPTAAGPGSAPAVPVEAGDLLSNVPVQGLPAGSRRPPREESRITQFNRRAGDNSRAVLLLVVLAAAALIIFQVTYKKEVPPELAEPSPGPALPKELVREALEKAPTQEPEVQPLAPVDAGAAPVAAAEPPVAAEAGQAGQAASSAREGRLVLESDPPVDVFVGNQALGRTPIAAKLPEGRFRVRLTDRETGINLYRSYEVRAGQRTEDKLRIETGGLVVKAPAGATILLNGRVLGTAPLPKQTIYEGEYLLQVTVDGAKPWTQRFEALANRDVTYEVKMGPGQ